jgi:LssY C-terminus
MPSPADPRTEIPAQRRHLIHVLLAGIGVYLLGAYLFIPFAWSRYAKHHPAFDDNPRLSETGVRHPGDPLNVALVGSKEQVDAIMKAANWDPAAALGVRSDLKIAEDTVLKRSDADAPVSNLFLFDRKEDLAFEQPVGGNPRQRNHVRFWKMDKTYDDGRPIWVGAASYDERVGLSHTTGQITHHIAPDVDKERDHLFADLKQTGDLSDQYKINGFHTQLEGHNGGGDRWLTDGALYVGVIKPALQ